MKKTRRTKKATEVFNVRNLFRLKTIRSGYRKGKNMAYEIEEINVSQRIFYRLLQNSEISEEYDPELFKAYAENEEIQNLVKSQAEIAGSSVEKYGDVIYLLPDEDNTFLGYSKNKLKETLCKSNATDKDFYLSQFVIITFLVEMYDGQGITSKSRDEIRVGMLQNIISERLKSGVDRYSEDDESRQGIAYRNMQEAYESLKSDDKGSRARTTKEGFLYNILIFLEKQGLIDYIQEDETVKTTKKLDNLMDYNLLNKNNYQRVRRVLKETEGSINE